MWVSAYRHLLQYLRCILQATCDSEPFGTVKIIGQYLIAIVQETLVKSFFQSFALPYDTPLTVRLGRNLLRSHETGAVDKLID